MPYKDPKAGAAYRQSYNKKNRARLRNYHRKYRGKNKNRIRALAALRQRKYRQAHPEQVRAMNNRIRRNRRTKYRTWLSDYKAQRGCKCGEKDPRCLLFHHTGESKKGFTIGGQGYYTDNSKYARVDIANRAWTDILAEIRKCIVMCANCHLKLHSPK